MIKIKEKALKDIKAREPLISENDCLAYFLNDVNEKGFGMYIAAGYEFFIKKQNEFSIISIQKIKSQLPNNDPYIRDLNREIF